MYLLTILDHLQILSSLALVIMKNKLKGKTTSRFLANLCSMISSQQQQNATTQVLACTMTPNNSTIRDPISIQNIRKYLINLNALVIPKRPKLATRFDLSKRSIGCLALANIIMRLEKLESLILSNSCLLCVPRNQILLILLSNVLIGSIS